MTATVPTLASVLLTHFEGANYELIGDGYAGLRWLDDTPKPTEAQLAALADPTGVYRREAARAAVDAERDRLLAGGFRHNFGGAIGAKLLQTRGVDDRVNWLTSESEYAAACAAGRGAEIGARFRGADNVTFTVSYAAGLDALGAMRAWGNAVMARSWALKDALAAGASLATFDPLSGWPG